VPGSSPASRLGLDDMMARYASYETFAEIIRHRFDAPKETLKELFSRIVFNILCGNTDDHARNHAAFWDGNALRLTPAYDICPQSRAGNEATQAMLISGNNRLSHLKSCLDAAHHFLLSEIEAQMICDKQRKTIEAYWKEVCDEANLNTIARKLLWKRQFLSPCVF
jgi:serine/threonine-protein kinase HipA